MAALPDKRRGESRSVELDSIRGQLDVTDAPKHGENSLDALVAGAEQVEVACRAVSAARPEIEQRRALGHHREVPYHLLRGDPALSVGEDGGVGSGTIRDIRSSERRFYQKVLDIDATSVDYTPNTDQSKEFFATVQNKMHWATHGHTAAEVVFLRADARKPLMGLKSTRSGGIVRKEDASIAKNYLNEEVLHALNRIVNAYLEFAEVYGQIRRTLSKSDEL